MINRAFANYATRVSFNLTLTKAQVFYLWQVKNRQFVSVREDIQGFSPEVPRHDIFVPSVRGLVERGLVDFTPLERVDVDTWPYKLTEAGEHVYALLKLAGLVQEALPVEKAA